MELERKSLPFSLKADGPDGSFKAVFATLGVVDLDGDVTRPGAFKDGAEVIVGSWGHKTEELPVGKGVIRANDREAVVEGAFFLDTEPGKATYQTVKNLGALGEWSYVFTVARQSFGEFEGRQVRFLEDMNVFSVDPVLKGAGIDTRTTAIKSMPFLDHVEDIEDQVAAFVARVKERSELLKRENRVLSAGNVERLESVAKALEDSVAELKGLAATGPKSAESNQTLAREYARFQHILAGLPA